MIKIDQYRDIWLSEKFDDVIGFYPREFYPLDNFSSFKVEYNGYLYSSAEEAFQANLFIDEFPEIAEKIKKVILHMKLKRLGLCMKIRLK